MIDIALQATANQELSMPLGGSRYVITIKEANGIMAATIVRDNETILEMGRIVADSLILPYRHQWYGHGNFMLSTEDEELPYYDKFGITQFLVYVSEEEMVAAGLV